MNKETINNIATWLLALICIGASIAFASKGDKETAAAFGLGGGLIIYFKLAAD